MLASPMQPTLPGPALPVRELTTFESRFTRHRRPGGGTVRRLQDGDIDGHMRRAMDRFPIAGVADAVLKRYFLPEGRRPDQPYKLIPMYKQRVSVARHQLTMLANFAEVYLAKEGHSEPLGITPPAT